MFHQVLSGVGHAHNHHICHRDLKLDNILLGDAGLAHVKVADFGLSDFYRPGESMRSNCGSLSYLAPEIFRGTSNAGPPLDVWSLGVILFAMLFGRLPFEGSDLTGATRPRDTLIRNRICKCQVQRGGQPGELACIWTKGTGCRGSERREERGGRREGSRDRERSTKHRRCLRIDPGFGPAF